LDRYFFKNNSGIILFIITKNQKILKKYYKIFYPLKGLYKQFHKDFFKNSGSVIHSFISDISGWGVFNNFRIRMVLFTLLFFLGSIRAFAPDSNITAIPEPSCIRPFSDLMHAIAMVETVGNPLAYNELENAVGIFQIRQVRVDEYNRLTGSKYVLKDMFDHSVSEKVFLYFASQIGPYNFEKIAKRWNGSGPRTELYWKRIKKYL